MYQDETASRFGSGFRVHTVLCTIDRIGTLRKVLVLISESVLLLPVRFLSAQISFRTNEGWLEEGTHFRASNSERLTFSAFQPKP